MTFLLPSATRLLPFLQSLPSRNGAWGNAGYAIRNRPNLMVTPATRIAMPSGLIQLLSYAAFHRHFVLAFWAH